MSVLIQGMDMPTEGTVIAIYKLSGKFYALSAHGTELCPLVPVHAPHGKLIDADVILNEKAFGTQIAGFGKMFHESVIEYAPAVIPAEEGE